MQLYGQKGVERTTVHGLQPLTKAGSVLTVNHCVLREAYSVLLPYPRSISVLSPMFRVRVSPRIPVSLPIRE